MSYFSTISFFLLLSLWSAVISDAASFQKLYTTNNMSLRFGPESIAFDSTGKGFYTGVSGGLIFKYTPDKGFVNFAQMTPFSDEELCEGFIEPRWLPVCGRPMGLAFNEKTGDLYVADALLGLHIVSPAGGLAVKIANKVDGKLFSNLDGVDVDPTTGVVYFTSLSSSLSPYQHHWPLNDATGKLYKYDPSTQAVTTVMEGLSRPAGCVVSSDGSFVLVSQSTKNNIKRYWIKGPKAGSSEDFTNSIFNPNNIRRIDSTGNFWIASAEHGNAIFGNQSAVKVNSNGEVFQTILLKNITRNTLLSEVNEFNGSLYFGTPNNDYVGILKL